MSYNQLIEQYLNRFVCKYLLVKFLIVMYMFNKIRYSQKTVAGCL